jgi:hypothetical protein
VFTWAETPSTSTRIMRFCWEITQTKCHWGFTTWRDQEPGCWIGDQSHKSNHTTQLELCRVSLGNCEFYFR